MIEPRKYGALHKRTLIGRSLNYQIKGRNFLVIIR